MRWSFYCLGGCDHKAAWMEARKEGGGTYTAFFLPLENECLDEMMELIHLVLHCLS